MTGSNKTRSRVQSLTRSVAGVAAALTMVLLLFCDTASAANTKQQEKDSLANSGYREVTAQEAEEIGIRYYNNRNRYSEPEKIFCEGPLNSMLEKLYTESVNCYSSYEQCAMAAFIMYKRHTYHVTYSFDVEFGEVRQGRMTDKQYEAAKEKAKKLSYQFNYGSDFDKIERTYEWICDNMKYDDSLQRGSIYDALVLGDTVCTGYASAFQLIMEEMGIESYLVQGMIDGEGHEWNAVKLDGKYYFVDVTFGDTSGQHKKYLLFGTDRRKNETYLDITSKSRYFSYDDIRYDDLTEEQIKMIMAVLCIIFLAVVLIVILVVVLCISHDKKKRKRRMQQMQQNGYPISSGYPPNPMYGGPSYGGMSNPGMGPNYGGYRPGMGPNYGGYRPGMGPGYGGTPNPNTGPNYGGNPNMGSNYGGYPGIGPAGGYPPLPRPPYPTGDANQGPGYEETPNPNVGPNYGGNPNMGPNYSGNPNTGSGYAEVPGSMYGGSPVQSPDNGQNTGLMPQNEGPQEERNSKPLADLPENSPDQTQIDEMPYFNNSRYIGKTSDFNANVNDSISASGSLFDVNNEDTTDDFR